MIWQYSTFTFWYQKCFQPSVMRLNICLVSFLTSLSFHKKYFHVLHQTRLILTNIKNCSGTKNTHTSFRWSFCSGNIVFFLCNNTHPQPISEQDLEHTPGPWPVTPLRKDGCSELSGRGGGDRSEHASFCCFVPDETRNSETTWADEIPLRRQQLKHFFKIFYIHLIYVLLCRHNCGSY